jgi:hypothetical protein
MWPLLTACAPCCCTAAQAPKLPNAADMSIAKPLFKKYNHSSSVCIGLPGNKDPQQFKVGM